MELYNDQSTPVDPVPFLVSVIAGFLVLYTFGPGYLMAFGMDLPGALAAVTGMFGCTVVVAYRRFVWHARPRRRAEVPGAVRFRRLVYAIAAGFGLVVLLLLPVHF